MSEERNTPEIRFEGFEEEWKSSPFKEIVKRVSKQSENTNLPRVEFEDIISSEGRLNKDISQKEDDRKGMHFKPNYILYGKLRPYLNNWLLPDFEGIALGDFWVFESIEATPGFTYYLIQTPLYQKVANISSGTKMPRSDWKTVSNTKFRLPIKNNEQAQIGKFLKRIDELIENSQKNIKDIEQFKQAMLQKMFPKEGETVPEVRFEGFEEKWEQRNLGRSGYTFTGISGKSKEDFGHGEARYIPYTNVFNNPITDLEDLEKIEIDRMQNEVQYGDVFFTTSSETPEEVGMASVWKHNGKNVYLNSFCFGYRPTEEFDLDFLAYLLHSPLIRGQFQILAQGISRFNISKTKAMNIEFLVPTIKEQKEIGKYFINLQKNIDSKQSELDKLKQFKQAMLDKMFV